MRNETFKQLANKAAFQYREFEEKLLDATKEAAQVMPDRREEIEEMGASIFINTDENGTSLSTLVSYEKFEKEFADHLSAEGRASFSDSRKLANKFGKTKYELNALLEEMDPSEAEALKSEFSQSPTWLPALANVVGDQVVALESEPQLDLDALNDVVDSLAPQEVPQKKKDSVYRVNMSLSVDLGLLTAVKEGKKYDEVLIGSSLADAEAKVRKSILDELGIFIELNSSEEISIPGLDK